MTKWQRHLRLKDVYHSGKPIPELAEIVAKRLRNISVPDSITYLEDERDLIAENFEDLAKDKNASAEDFDEVMAELYDWADYPLDGKVFGEKLCWVETISLNRRYGRG